MPTTTLSHLARKHAVLLVAFAALFTSAGASAAVNVNARMYLQGALTGNGLPMRTDLRADPSFPLTDPYGLGTVAPSVPATAVDWVKVELLAGSSAAACLPGQAVAGFLLADGSLVAANGGPLTIPSAQPGSYNLRVSHRNHGALISVPAPFAAAGSALLDMTVLANVANPDSLAVTAAVVAAQAGDANGDQAVYAANTGNDLDAIANYPGAGAPGGATHVYAREDINMDGTVLSLASTPGSDRDFLSAVLNNDPSNGYFDINDGFPSTGALCAAGAQPVAAPPAPIPALSPGMLGALSGLLAIAGAGLRSRRRAFSRGARPPSSGS